MQCKLGIQNFTDKFREGRNNTLKSKYIFAYGTCELKNTGWGTTSWQLFQVKCWQILDRHQSNKYQRLDICYEKIKYHTVKSYQYCQKDPGTSFCPNGKALDEVLHLVQSPGIPYGCEPTTEYWEKSRSFPANISSWDRPCYLPANKNTPALYPALHQCKH